MENFTPIQGRIARFLQLKIPDVAIKHADVAHLNEFHVEKPIRQRATKHVRSFGISVNDANRDISKYLGLIDASRKSYR